MVSGVQVATMIRSMLERIDPAQFQRLLRGLRAHVGGEFVLRRDAPLADAGARADPLVARIDHLLQLGVGQHAAGQIGAGGDDRGAAPLGGSGHEIKASARWRAVIGHDRSSCCAISSMMCGLTCCSHRLARDADGVADRLGRRVAVRLDADAVDAEQRHAAVFLGVGAAADGVERLLGHASRRPCGRGPSSARAAASEKIAPARLSAVFRITLPTKPSQTTTSTALLKRSCPSTLPMKLICARESSL